MFEALLNSQGGLCAVCKSMPATDLDHSHRLAALHPHPDGAYCVYCMRGALCNGCNTMLGRAHDSEVVLARGIEYLRVWKAKGRV